MERVQFQQEQMLAELKDLVQKGLFTEKEIKHIMKKRTAYETALVRRIAKKNDFLRYAAYEMGLEALRRKRAERIKVPKGPPTISDYALVRRQFQIFERALKKFKSDIGLWIQYIQVAKKEGARSLVGRITARALQLFPNIPAFYILAASHELEHLSPSAARTLLQRGIRLNAESVEMWREYVKMELGFVESMRRRWNVLGIEVSDKGKAKAGEREPLADEEVEKMEINAAEPEGDESEAARREILGGAIVKSVITSAAKALPKPELFIQLHDLISKYPSPPALRLSLLDHLHDLLQHILPHNARAIQLTATRFLTPDVKGPELVDRLKEANEKLSDALRDGISNGQAKTREEHEELYAIANVYTDFVDEWCRKEDVDRSLKAYLLASLRSVIQYTNDASIPLSPLLTRHLTLLTYFSNQQQSDLASDIPFLPSSSKILKLARKYTAIPSTRSSSRLWLARLNAERALLIRDGENEDGNWGDKVRKTWKEARENVSGEGVIEVWMWGVDVNEGRDSEEQVKLLETLLTESLRMQDSPSWKTVHEKLLQHYASLVIQTTVLWSANETGVQKRLLHLVRRVKLSNIPTSRVWDHIFTITASLCSSTSGTASRISPGTIQPVLQQIHAHWRSLDVPSSSLTYATWLLQNDRAKESLEIIKGALQVLNGAERVELEKRWRDVVDRRSFGHPEAEPEGADEGDEDVHMTSDADTSP